MDSWSDSDNLHLAAAACLACADPDEKLRLTAVAAQAHAAGALCAGPGVAAQAIGEPGRPSRPRLVLPRDVPQRGLGSEEGRAALVHAVAHIEFNAINLAWDAVYRFRDMPEAYYADWVGVAADEARHFALLRTRLRELGHDYGDFDAHNGLWQMARKTAHSCLARMALVPRVLEARGLDVTPGMIARLRGVDDNRSSSMARSRSAGSSCASHGMPSSSSWRGGRRRWYREASGLMMGDHRPSLGKVLGEQTRRLSSK